VEADTEDADQASSRNEVVDALFDENLASVPHGPLVAVHPSTSVADTIRAMNQQHTGCAVVADEATGELVGIFTERDVLTRVAVRNLDSEKTPVAEVMTRDPDTLPAEATVAYALRQMTVEGYRNIPLVDAGRRPVGVIAVRDIVAWLCELFPGNVLNLPPTLSFPTSEDGG
ncbi:MAG TPA: CBS domain-containing protein, partial [Myxococcales bacterium]|nr:CBS domain-containing protein [Myxococcales bacterium]